MNKKRGRKPIIFTDSELNDLKIKYLEIGSCHIIGEQLNICADVIIKALRDYGVNIPKNACKGGRPKKNIINR
jgi:hypothetical protein